MLNTHALPNYAKRASYIVTVQKLSKKTILTVQNQIPTKYDVLLRINSSPEPLTRAAHENCTETQQYSLTSHLLDTETTELAMSW